MIDPRKTVERHEVEEGYFREMIGDLASKNEELETENHHLQTAAADVMAENVRLEGEVERITTEREFLKKNALVWADNKYRSQITMLEDRVLELVGKNEGLTESLGKCSQARTELAAAIKPVADMYNENFGVSRITIEWQQNGEWHESYYDPLPLSRLARALKGIKE